MKGQIRIIAETNKQTDKSQINKRSSLKARALKMPYTCETVPFLDIGQIINTCTHHSAFYKHLQCIQEKDIYNKSFNDRSNNGKYTIESRL